ETSSARGLRALAQESFLAYELEMGPLDRGVRPSSVGPGKRISFVATAALAVRRSAWQEVGGFDPALRFGEDIDFSWRVCNHGWSIRYEPSSVLGHEIRDDLFGMLLQRYQYGTPAAVLASRYPDAFRTIEVEPSSALSFVLACAGHGLAGSAVVGASAVVSARRLTRIGIGWTDAVRKVGREQVRDGINLMWTMRRDFWPLTLLLAVLSRRFRRIAFGAAVLGPLLEWVRRRPALSPARWLVLSLGDGLAHGAGVWRSCLRARSFEALVPAWRSIPSEASTVADRDPNRSICRP
ncbi:MAG TPA: glycosyltransferase family 2 protein, partial [Acidimicrobiales bacterium]|nr:glycosyltransferase family 2 protein [Acidimicrobiales bacterium]